MRTQGSPHDRSSRSSLRRVGAVSVVALATALHSQADAQVLSIDQLLSIESVVSGTPAWSPRGSEILVQSALTGGLTTISPDGGFPVRIPVDMGSSGHFLASQMPGWSPEGRWISYVSDKSGAPEIWLWSADDGSEVQLTSLGARINSMSWSPDERRIAFAGDRYGNYDIWTADVATGRVRRLTTDVRYDVFPTWTPDSERILYVRLDDAWEDHEVVAVDADGRNPTIVLTDTDFFDYRAGGTFGYPQPSPDGRHVLFPSHRSGWINYWLAPLSGASEEPRQIAPAEADQSAAKWSPDGRWIAYTENHNGHHDLRVVSADGGQPRVLVSPDEGVVSAPSWAPGSDALAYFAEGLTKPKDLFTVSLDEGKTRQLTRSMPAGGFEDRLVVPEKVSYASTDGYEISAYLYRPPTTSGGNRPGVLWIHGGPTSQFNDTFSSTSSSSPNGATSCSCPTSGAVRATGSPSPTATTVAGDTATWRTWWQAGEYLKTLQEVDPERIGITGTSYGGVMTMYAVAFSPGYFRAGIAGSGYADWVHFYHGEKRAAPRQAAGARAGTVRHQPRRLAAQFGDHRCGEGGDARVHGPRGRTLPGLRPVGTLRPRAGELLQALPLHDLPQRELLRLRQGQPPQDAHGHARFLRPVPEGRNGDDQRGTLGSARARGCRPPATNT